MEEEGKVQVPQHLQDGNRDARDLGHGVGYVYPHEAEGHHVGQQYLPTVLLGTYFYSPSQEGYVARVKDRLARWRAAQERHLGSSRPRPCPISVKRVSRKSSTGWVGGGLPAHELSSLSLVAK